MSTVTLNKKIPHFSAQATGDQVFKLSDYKGRHVVLYFYPKDNTPGCTLEGQMVGLEGTFENTLDGIGLLVQRLPNPRETCVLYESTGVYGKKLAAYLVGQVGMLCEVNPKIIKNAASTMTQTKTDVTDARAIAQAARTLYLTRRQTLENALINEQRDEEVAVWIKEYDRLRRAISQLKCQISTLQQHPAKAAAQILVRMKRELKQLMQSQKQVHQKIERITKTREDIQRIASIKGIGLLTAAALANRIGSIHRFSSADHWCGYQSQQHPNLYKEEPGSEHPIRNRSQRDL